MVSHSTLVVIGRTESTTKKDRLSSLLANSLANASSDKNAEANQLFTQFACSFVQPTLSGEFGLTSLYTDPSKHHSLRVLHHPNVEQFRSALREALAHALKTARPSEAQSSIDGRVNIVYAGQVFAPNGEWLLADSAVTGQQLIRWLDSDAARSWWPQLEKFPNIGDRLSLHVLTPLAGSNTAWIPGKNGHSVLSHVDVSMVQVTLQFEASWRLNGKPVSMVDPSIMATLDGIRSFSQQLIDHHPESRFSLPSDGAPLNCALSAERPSMYVFPGGASPACGLFALQGFTLLMGGCYASHAAPKWWSMVRNLPKLDSVVLADWSAGSLLTYQFIHQARLSDDQATTILGELLTPPPCAAGDVTSDMVLLAPTNISETHCYQWAPNTLVSDAASTPITLYFKLGWGELKLQPLAQRSGLLLVWTSAVPHGSQPTALRILLPANQLTGANAAQGLSRLVKSLHGLEQTSRVASATRPAAQRASMPRFPNARPVSATKPTRTSLPAANRATATSQPAVPTKPELVPSSRRSTNVATKPAAAKPQEPRQRQSSAPAPKPSLPKTSPPKPTTKQQPTAKPKTETTANKLAAHANLVAGKQSSNKLKPATQPAEPKPQPSANPPTASQAPTSKYAPTAPTAEQISESMALAPMDPLISGWQAADLHHSVEPSLPTVEEQATPLSTPASELYKVHKFQHLNEADEMALGEQSGKEKMDDVAISEDAQKLLQAHPDTDFRKVAEPTEELVPKTVEEVVKLIDPVQNIMDEHLTEEPVILDRQEFTSMSRPPPLMGSTEDIEGSTDYHMNETGNQESRVIQKDGPVLHSEDKSVSDNQEMFAHQQDSLTPSNQVLLEDSRDFATSYEDHLTFEPKHEEVHTTEELPHHETQMLHPTDDIEHQTPEVTAEVPKQITEVNELDEAASLHEYQMKHNEIKVDLKPEEYNDLFQKIPTMSATIPFEHATPTVRLSDEGESAAVVNEEPVTPAVTSRPIEQLEQPSSPMEMPSHGFETIGVSEPYLMTEKDHFEHGSTTEAAQLVNEPHIQESTRSFPMPDLICPFSTQPPTADPNKLEMIYDDGHAQKASSDVSDSENNEREYWFDGAKKPVHDFDGEPLSPDSGDIVLDGQGLVEDISQPEQPDSSKEPQQTVNSNPMESVRVSADSLEVNPDPLEVEQCDSTAVLEATRASAPLPDTTTVDTDDVIKQPMILGFTAMSGEDPTSLESPKSNTSVDSVVHRGPMDCVENQPIGFKDFAQSNGAELEPGLEYNGLDQSNDQQQFSPNAKQMSMPFLPGEFEASERRFAAEYQPDPTQPGGYPDHEVDFFKVANVPVEDDPAKPNTFDPLSNWGHPQGLPPPTPQTLPTNRSRTSTTAPTSGTGRPSTASGRPSTASKVPLASGKPSAPTPPVTLPAGPPIYLDLIWVPSYLVHVPHHLAVEFFSRVRARFYVLSGEALDPTVGEALIQGKSKWAPGDMEHFSNATNTPPKISILPTDEPYEWACWLRTPCGRVDHATGETRLHAAGIEVMPTASLCDIEYSANNVAFRCEGVRVDF